MHFFSYLIGSFDQVILGGVDVRSLPLSTLRWRFGFVGQEPVLFDTTVAENIRYGKNGATKQEIEQAARDANIHDFVSRSLPDGYDTNVGGCGMQGHEFLRGASRSIRWE